MKSEDLAPGDDYAMMREMLTRRFTKLAKEKDEPNGWAAPDLVLIDGGPGQLAAAHAVLDELGLSERSCRGVAKGPDATPAANASICAAASPCCWSRAIRCSIASRRFATRPIASPSAPIAPGARRPSAPRRSTRCRALGRARKRALLQHFGSAKAVSRAGIADLEAVGGISAQMAKAIYDHFHERG